MWCAISQMGEELRELATKEDSSESEDKEQGFGSEGSYREES